jgi:hypothetical protein
MNFEESALFLTQTLHELKIPYMFMGGLAVNAYGFLRATFDLDVVIALEEKNIKPLVLALKKKGFDLKEEDVKTILKSGNRFMSRTFRSPHRIDFWLLKTDFDHRAFLRRRRKTIFNQKIWMISPEDLILTKLLYGGRGKDLDDVVGILKRQGQKLDKIYLKKEAKELGIEKIFNRLQ